MIGGLFATKVVSAAVSSDEIMDTGVALRSNAALGDDTLTSIDRSALVPDAEDASGALPVLSAMVRYLPEIEPSAVVDAAKPVSRAKPATAKRPVVRATRQAGKQSEPVKAAAAVPCRQLDPIARFLVSANLAPRCAS
jgi:hypothetical protein